MKDPEDMTPQEIDEELWTNEDLIEKLEKSIRRTKILLVIAVAFTIYQIVKLVLLLSQ